MTAHPSFDNEDMYNDVALLHLEEDFKLQPHIDTICIPPPNNRYAFIASECQATGWGMVKYGMRIKHVKLYIMIPD